MGESADGGIWGSREDPRVRDSGRSADEVRECDVEVLRAGREVVEERGEHVCEQCVTHRHERCHGWKISVERAKYQSKTVRNKLVLNER